jgi:hypothetical protein
MKPVPGLIYSAIQNGKVIFTGKLDWVRPFHDVKTLKSRGDLYHLSNEKGDYELCFASDTELVDPEHAPVPALKTAAERAVEPYLTV